MTARTRPTVLLGRFLPAIWDRIATMPADELREVVLAFAESVEASARAVFLHRFGTVPDEGRAYQTMVHHSTPMSAGLCPDGGPPSFCEHPIAVGGSTSAVTGTCEGGPRPGAASVEDHRVRRLIAVSANRGGAPTARVFAW